METAFSTQLLALRRPLEFAARDGFAGIERVKDLGTVLTRAAAGLLPLVADKHRPLIAKWHEHVGRFSELPRTEQERLVALGLRLCLGVAIADTKNPARAIVASAAAIPNAPLGLHSPLTILSGCGPVTYEKLVAKGLETVSDLLHFVPRRWDDLRKEIPLAALLPGELVRTRGQVKKARTIFMRGRGRMLEVEFVDGNASVIARWFQFRGAMQERFAVGAWFGISGVPKTYKDSLQFVHPETMLLEEGVETAGGIRTRYSEVEGVPDRLLAKMSKEACTRFGALVPDGIPADVIARHELSAQGQALGFLHAPPQDMDEGELAALIDGTHVAQRRLIFDEFFFLQLGLQMRRGDVRKESAPAVKSTAKTLQKFTRALPFTLTGAQKRAIEEIRADIAQPHPMNRLLQGDVGSGKTAVAYAACELACAAGLQAAIMAPTELLAEQHARTLIPWAEATGRRIQLLTASTPRQVRESALALLAAGQLDIVIGTHALLASRVVFAQLGLVVIDEQHRFGVAQRARLREKGMAAKNNDGPDARSTGALLPHLLVMTATPIPRTLALTVYGDLDVTLLDELPPGRLPAKTKSFAGKRARIEALKAVNAHIDAGRQVYWVCPLIEESETLDFADVTEAETFLRAQLDVPVGLVHGRLSALERDQVMSNFRSGKIKLLVATTVIEVGVDVPAATLMVIEGAERFGLSQLHQLRGRIGRGGGESQCLLLATHRSDNERLEVMTQTHDGFKIAEADLRIRGPGEIFGTRQSGLPRLRFADLIRDVEWLRVARNEALALLKEDPDLKAHPQTNDVLQARWREAKLFGEEAG